MHLIERIQQAADSAAAAADSLAVPSSSLSREIAVAVAAVVVLFFALRLIDRALERRAQVTQFSRQLTLIALTVLAALIALLALPDSIAGNQEVIQLVGIAATVLVTLSSQTLVANAMAGLMLRSVKSFRPGDFVKVDSHFGRVSERGLFHIEIQTAQRDLVTLPNQFLLTRPMTVVRSSGTVITADVSLGYDAAHQVIEPLLIQAAERAGLDEPFVQVLELGDYTVTYRISGFLTDVKTLFTAQSTLRRRILDTLHDDAVEIASPMLLAYRALAEGKGIMPAIDAAVLTHREDEESEAPADLIFDKAEEAEAEDRAKGELDELRAAEKSLEHEAKKCDELERPKVEARLEETRAEIEALEAELTAMEEEGDDRAG
jgi:small conductance mechanosensitive channel